METIIKVKAEELDNALVEKLKAVLLGLKMSLCLQCIHQDFHLSFYKLLAYKAHYYYLR